MLKKRGRYYWTDFYVNGKRIRQSLKTTEKLVALDRLRVLQDQLKSESEAKDIRFDNFCEQYMKWAWAEKPSSAPHEKGRIAKIQTFFKAQGVKLLSDITPYHIEQFKAYLKNQTKPRKLAKSTINLYLQQIRGMFNHAIDWGMYSEESPMKKVRTYRTSPTVTILTDSQVKKILKACEEISNNPRSSVHREIYSMVRFALNTGLRKTELLRLKWRDIKDNELVIRGKGEKTRIIPLNSIAKEILGSQVREGGEYVFAIQNRNRNPVLQRTVNKVRKLSGVPIFRMHLLRHYFATKLMEQGIDIITISELLGHSQITMSLLYSHTNASRKKSAVDSLVTKQVTED